MNEWIFIALDFLNTILGHVLSLSVSFKMVALTFDVVVVVVVIFQ